LIQTEHVDKRTSSLKMTKNCGRNMSEQ